MKPILEFGVFKRLQDKDAFKRVKVSFDTIEWDCGVDLDPEYVYAQCMATKPATERERSTRRVATESAVGESGEEYKV